MEIKVTNTETQNKHIYPIEEKMYTIEQLEQSFDAGFSQGIDVGEYGVYSTKPNFEEWIKTLKL